MRNVHVQYQKKEMKLFGRIMREEALENSGHVEDDRDKGSR